MHALRKRGVDMQKVMLCSGRKFSPPVIRVLNEGLKLLEKLVQECSVKGAPMPRKIPFCIFFQGESRVGKSLLMNKFVKEMQNELGLPADQVYARNGLDEYCAPLPLNMASLHEKGMFFDSQVVIASTNFLEPSPESQVRDKDAFRNRRHVLIQVVKDPTKEYDPCDFTANQRYNLLTHTGLGNYRTVREFESYRDLHVFIINKWNDHNAEQEKNLMQHGDAMFDVEQPVKHMRDVLELSRSLTGFVSQISDAESAEQETVHFLTFEHLGKLRSFWWNEVTMEVYERPVEFIKQEQIEAELKRTGQMSLIIYEFLKLNEKTNVIIKNNLADLACADMWDSKFQYVGQIGKPAFNSMLIPEIMQLPKWQRIALCCIGAYFNREKKVSFVTRLLGKLKDFLVTLYKQEFSEWPVAAKILVGIAFASLAAVGMWKMYEMLRSAVGGASIVSAAATAFTTRPNVEAQSKKPNRYDVSSYKYRNVPLRQRAWAEAQMSIDQSHVMLMEKVMASFSFGLNKIQFKLFK
ncbi:hypothetical protein T459_21247 [Capsicum annuum]|uniref:SF3 helicase domain-containing protein n=1 Tax=Capsicum annuum TaxID=4072 RepID=A0A2G2YW30_CAPAN|nr:hypothetical protein T459_21247 [Capsicum annuum]